MKINNGGLNLGPQPVKGQNSKDDNSCKSDVQVSIYLKLLLINLNPAVFLLIPKS